MSKSRQNWSEECENHINYQINKELYASYYYLNLYCFFMRDWVNMPEIAKYFKKQSDEEKEHADKFIEYQILRGGTIKIKEIPEINFDFDDKCKSKSYLKIAFEKVLDLEKNINNNLLEIHKVGDPSLCEFLESNFLNEQIEANDEIARIIDELEFIINNKYDLLSYITKFNNRFK